MQIIDLAATGYFLENSFFYNLHAVGLDKGLYRTPVPGRCLKDRKIPYLKQ